MVGTVFRRAGASRTRRCDRLHARLVQRRQLVRVRSEWIRLRAGQRHDRSDRLVGERKRLELRVRRRRVVRRRWGRWRGRRMVEGPGRSACSAGDRLGIRRTLGTFLADQRSVTGAARAGWGVAGRRKLIDIRRCPAPLSLAFLLSPCDAATVIPGTASPNPGSSAALRAMLGPVAPSGRTQPTTTSSTSAGSMPARFTAREAGRQDSTPGAGGFDRALVAPDESSPPFTVIVARALADLVLQTVLPDAVLRVGM